MVLVLDRLCVKYGLEPGRREPSVRIVGSSHSYPGVAPGSVEHAPPYDSSVSDIDNYAPSRNITGPEHTWHAFTHAVSTGHRFAPSTGCYVSI
eukprot:2440258-Rhodomonas_salina.10